MPHKILLVDHDRDLVDLISHNLRRNGYQVISARDAKAGLALARDERPDLVILEIMMSGMSGFEMCAALRDDAEIAETAVLMLTSRTAEADELHALDIGADDYLTKPVSPKLLLSRVRALLRRMSERKPGTADKVLKVHDLVIDRVRYIVLRNAETEKEERFHFPRKEFELLFLLATIPGRVFSREELLDRIWGTDVYVSNRTVDVHVRKVRMKLGSDYIQTVKGVGYRFAEDISE
jgi:two-component system alkaline phosphatase synthesis response regulator PhoP